MEPVAVPPRVRLVRRCAWCGRCWDRGRWRTPDQLDAETRSLPTTDGICAGCRRRLQDEGTSV
ncbi:MAG TPA: hypothetical protein VK874_05755 [Gaiellaceae bacterium]|nr:hypothetical protein [Gaiellaceae bacterium]